jgi:hypothetical protein
VQQEMTVEAMCDRPVHPPLEEREVRVGGEGLEGLLAVQPEAHLRAQVAPQAARAREISGEVEEALGVRERKRRVHRAERLGHRRRIRAHARADQSEIEGEAVAGERRAQLRHVRLPDRHRRALGDGGPWHSAIQSVHDSCWASYGS